MEPTDLGAGAVDAAVFVERAPDHRPSPGEFVRKMRLENHLQSVRSGLCRLVALGDPVDDAAVLVERRADHEYSEEYPQKMLAKGTVRLQDGTTIEHEVQDFPGLASHPFTWDDEVEKFDHLVAGRIDETLSQEIKDAVRSLESIQVKDLMELLGRARAPE